MFCIHNCPSVIFTFGIVRRYFLLLTADAQGQLILFTVSFTVSCWEDLHLCPSDSCIQVFKENIKRLDRKLSAIVLHINIIHLPVLAGIAIIILFIPNLKEFQNKSTRRSYYISSSPSEHWQMLLHLGLMSSLICLKGLHWCLQWIRKI